MELYAHLEDANCAEAVAALKLAELTICASPSELRSIAVFFAATADEMDQMGEEYDHVHLADRHQEFLGSAHIVVVRSGGSAV